MLNPYQPSMQKLQGKPMTFEQMLAFISSCKEEYVVEVETDTDIELVIAFTTIRSRLLCFFSIYLYLY